MRKLVALFLLLVVVAVVVAFSFRGALEGELFLYRYRGRLATATICELPLLPLMVRQPFCRDAAQLYLRRLALNPAEETFRRGMAVNTLEAWQALSPLEELASLLEDEDGYVAAHVAQVMRRAVVDYHVPLDRLPTLLAGGMRSENLEVLIHTIDIFNHAGLLAQRRLALDNLVGVASRGYPHHWEEWRRLELDRLLQEVTAGPVTDTRHRIQFLHAVIWELQIGRDLPFPPEGIENLWAALPLESKQLFDDAWGGKLIYRPLESSLAPYELYSAGPNEIDQHGAGDDVMEAIPKW